MNIFRLNFWDIRGDLHGDHLFTRQWLEEIIPFKVTEKDTKRMTKKKSKDSSYNNETFHIKSDKPRFRNDKLNPIKDVDIVFLAGGTCRILFIQRKIIFVTR